MIPKNCRPKRQYSGFRMSAGFRRPMRYICRIRHSLRRIRKNHFPQLPFPSGRCRKQPPPHFHPPRFHPDVPHFQTANIFLPYAPIFPRDLTQSARNRRSGSSGCRDSASTANRTLPPHPWQSLRPPSRLYCPAGQILSAELPRPRRLLPLPPRPMRTVPPARMCWRPPSPRSWRRRRAMTSP